MKQNEAGHNRGMTPALLTSTLKYDGEKMYRMPALQGFQFRLDLLRCTNVLLVAGPAEELIRALLVKEILSILVTFLVQVHKISVADVTISSHIPTAYNQCTGKLIYSSSCSAGSRQPSIQLPVIYMFIYIPTYLPACMHAWPACMYDMPMLYQPFISSFHLSKV